ncbi:MAG: lipoate--protein ligase family protein [Planctomycetes bacterium]|nr:lipoate--protein ligase family protein [Planctomycetota bacterium]
MILKPAKIHLLDPGPLDPASNMALDEVLLESEGWWLRLTRWDRPCVTLGRFQSWPQNSSDESFPKIHPFSVQPVSVQPVSATQSLPAVRRVTGGGSIHHGEDLTIAIAGPCPSPLFPDRSPGKVASQISKVLGNLLSPEIHTRGGEDREKEMIDVIDCFQRRSPSDLVIEINGETVKAGGLALAFRPGRVLIEGSLHRGPASRPVDEDRSWMELLMREWLGSEGETAEKWQTDLTDEQAGRVFEAVKDRFGTVEWNRR